MESLNYKIQIIRSMHHNLLWGKFPIQEQTCWLPLQFSDFLTCESPISKLESSVLTESIKQHSVCQKKLKGVFSVCGFCFFFLMHMAKIETLYCASCTVWRDLTRSQKNKMLFLILTPSSYMTFLHLVTQYLFGFLKLWEIRSKLLEWCSKLQSHQKLQVKYLFDHVIQFCTLINLQGCFQFLNLLHIYAFFILPPAWKKKPNMNRVSSSSLPLE